ncbi:MAG TPA: hypothetical protein VNU26_16925 [Mycobacteriales bacterium]|nr:hypothetical protein [Mycobacteriales bacterium]
MNRRVLVAGVAAVVLAGTVAPGLAAQGTTGNGGPSGPHYTLNVIGVSKGKTADMTGNNGHRIFVPDYGKARIGLTEGAFAVLDANGTDANGAAFALPNPDPDGDGTTAYSVYVRALGKPGGSAKVQSCYDDAQTGETWCAVDLAGGVEPIEVTRSKGKSTFTNVSRDLLYVDVCTSYDSETQQCLDWEVQPLFSDSLDSYFWEYDNRGLKVAQFRFYEIPTEAWDLQP